MRGALAMDSDQQPGHRALAALDKVLAEKPHREGHDFSETTVALAAFRDGLIAEQRQSGETDRSVARLARLNSVISIVLGGHFPLGSVPWDEIEKVRGWLAELVADAELP
jgi:hypothetical protein